MRNTRTFALAAALLAFAATGCNGSGEQSNTNIPPAPHQPIPGQAPSGVPSAAPQAATGGATSAPAPTTTAAPAGGPVGAPTVAAAPDAGYDAAKAQKGYADVKKLGKNPLGDTAATAQKGQPLFAQNCAPCHGATGQGDGAAGMALDPKPRNFTNTKEYQFGYGDLGIFRTGKYGVDGTGMAPWEGRMTDEQLWQVVAYIRTLQK